MGKIPTKVLLDEFFNTDTGKSRIRGRAALDTQNLYDYEMKIQKELIDMNPDELIDLIDYLVSKEGIDVNVATLSTVQFIISLLKAIFNYYIGNYERIINPFTYNVELMSTTKIMEELCSRKKPYTWDYVQEVMNEVRNCESESRANYYESIFLLAYDGFSSLNEVITLKEGMIDHRTKTVALERRTIKLSDRCYELLVKIHNYRGIMDNPRFTWIGWRDYYYSYCVKVRKQKENYNTREISKFSTYLNSFISGVNKKLSHDVYVDFSKLYRLGFYDFMVEKYGKDRTNHLITSVRNLQDADELLSTAKVYGWNTSNLTILKNDLRPFVR